MHNANFFPPKLSAKEKKLKREYLRSLPKFSYVIYQGPNIALSGSLLCKVFDRKNRMQVQKGLKEYRIPYENLTTEEYEQAQKMAKLLVKGNDLPF